jgi:hypothetical protein
MTLILKYSKNSDEIMTYIETETLGSNSFYNKRLYVVFFENALNIFSTTYIVENDILTHILKLFDTTLYILITKIISLLPGFYTLLKEDKKKLLDIKLRFLKNEYEAKNIKDIELKRVHSSLICSV